MIENNNSIVKEDVKVLEDSRKIHIDETSMINLFRGLAVLMDTQAVVSAMASGNALPAAGELPSKDQIRTYFLSIMVEEVELMNEFNWKPWKNGEKAINAEKVADEFADVLAFLGIILNYLRAHGIGLYDLALQYGVKSKVNMDRFNGKVEGY